MSQGTSILPDENVNLVCICYSLFLVSVNFIILLVIFFYLGDFIFKGEGHSKKHIFFVITNKKFILS